MKTQELQFVNFEQAKRLKEAGFSWDTPNRYLNTGSLNAVLYKDWNGTGLNEYAAPTVALALKWFRDVKGFDYSIIKGRLPFEYSYTLQNGGQGRLHIKGYEAAESALLDELLNLEK